MYMGASDGAIVVWAEFNSLAHLVGPLSFHGKEVDLARIVDGDRGHEDGAKVGGELNCDTLSFALHDHRLRVWEEVYWN